MPRRHRLHLLGLLSLLCGCSQKDDETPVSEVKDTETDTDEPAIATGDPTVQVTLVAPAGIRDLVAIATPADPAGEPVALAWSWAVDGAPSEITGDRVPASVVRPGEVWAVTVVPSAGDRVGAPATAEATIPEPLGGNLLVVVFDDMGVDKANYMRLSNNLQQTPTVDALAATGVAFTNAYASPLCSPSRAALLTGRHGRRTGVGGLVGSSSLEELPTEAITLAEALVGARAGVYESVALGKWHLASPDSATGIDSPNLQGFSWYAGSNDNFPDQNGYFDWEKITNGVVGRSTVYATTDTVNDALARIEAATSPWFAYVAFNAPHEPFHLPPPELHTRAVDETSSPVALYAAMLEAADTELGRLLAGIPESELRETTIVVVGDNGTSRPAVEPPFDPDESKHSVYEGGVHVPLIIAGPHVTAPGTTSAALVHIVDLFTTAADIAGVPLTTWEGGEALDLGGGEARVLDGISLVPWLADPALPSPRAEVYAEVFNPNGPPPYANSDDRTLRDDRWKLLRVDHSSGGEAPYDGFFDLANGAFDEGDDLLAGALTVEQQEAYDRLSAALEAQTAALPYEGR